MSSEVALPPPSARDAEIQAAVLPLVEAFAWREAMAVLRQRLREMEETRLSHIEQVFLEWSDLDPSDRPDFLTYAHKRRQPQVGA